MTGEGERADEVAENRQIGLGMLLAAGGASSFGVAITLTRLAYDGGREPLASCSKAAFSQWSSS